MHVLSTHTHVSQLFAGILAIQDGTLKKSAAKNRGISGRGYSMGSIDKAKAKLKGKTKPPPGPKGRGRGKGKAERGAGPAPGADAGLGFPGLPGMAIPGFEPLTLQDFDRVSPLFLTFALAMPEPWTNRTNRSCSNADVLAYFQPTCLHHVKRAAWIEVW